MKKKLIPMVLLVLSTAVSAESEKQMIVESKQSIKHFSAQLKSKLQEGMKQGGPVQAIQVCNTAAEQIQNQISGQQGWQISRTSLKLRNPKNSPDAWEQKVLMDFEQRLKSGEAVGKLETSEIINSTPPVFRYMKAIPTQGLCLSCHGDHLMPAVADKLGELYPEDQATGFKVGDIRGAFSIKRVIK